MHTAHTLIDLPNNDARLTSRDAPVSSLFPVPRRAHPGFRDTRQESVPVGSLQSRGNSRNTAAINTGRHQPGRYTHSWA